MSTDLVRQYVSGVAAALEQQSAATREISRSVQGASGALSGINDNVRKLTGGASSRRAWAEHP